MTHRSIPGHPLDELFESCSRYPGGVPAIAARLGVSDKTLYKKLRQQADTHHLSYDGELSRILFMLRDAKVEDWANTLHALCYRHDLIAVEIPAVVGNSFDELASLIMRVVKEQGDVAAAIGHALENDKAIDSRELAIINKEIEEAMRAVVAMRERVREMHEAAVAKGLVR